MLVTLQTQRRWEQLAVLRLVQVVDVEDLGLGALEGVKALEVLLDFGAGGVGVTIGRVELVDFLQTDLLLQVFKSTGLAVARWFEVRREGREAETAALALDSIALVRCLIRGVRLAQLNGGGGDRLDQLTVFLVDV